MGDHLTLLSQSSAMLKSLSPRPETKRDDTTTPCGRKLK